MSETVGDLARGRASIALDGYVQVDGVGAAQQVAHGAADEIRRRKPLERREQPLHAGQKPHALPQLARRRRHQSLTGIPASRIRSFASRTVW